MSGAQSATMSRTLDSGTKTLCGNAYQRGARWTASAPTRATSFHVRQSLPGRFCKEVLIGAGQQTSQHTGKVLGYVRVSSADRTSHVSWRSLATSTSSSGRRGPLVHLAERVFSNAVSGRSYVSSWTQQLGRLPSAAPTRAVDVEGATWTFLLPSELTKTLGSAAGRPVTVQWLRFDTGTLSGACAGTLFAAAVQVLFPGQLCYLALG